MRLVATVGQVLRFGAVGLLATAVHAAVASTYLLAGGESALGANLLGFCAAFLWSFAGHVYWVFRYKGRARDVFAKFAALSLISLAITSAISLVGDQLGLSPYWALAAIVLTVPTLSYVANLFWVFR